MRITLRLLLFFIITFTTKITNAQLQNNGDRGIYESYVILNINGSGATYYDLQANTGNPDFGGNLGYFGTNCSLIIDGGQNNTYKCNGCNILNGEFAYAIYPDG
jgi:phage-related protein